MKITEAIERADALYPNSYAREEKLRWAYELTAMIAEKYKKEYASFEFYGGTDGFHLPPSVLEEDIEGLYADGVWHDKTDERSFWQLIENEKNIKVVYKLRPKPYEETVHEGVFYVKGNSIVIPDTHFRTGDCLAIGQGEECTDYYIFDVQGDMYFFKDNFPFQGDTPLIVRYIVTADTPIPAPYDGIYINYLLGKIAYYQNDYEEQNKHMAQFNAKLSDYAKWYKQTNPIKTKISFRNVW